MRCSLSFARGCVWLFVGVLGMYWFVVVRCHVWFKITRVVYGCLLLIVVDANCVAVG